MECSALKGRRIPLPLMEYNSPRDATRPPRSPHPAPRPHPHHHNLTLQIATLNECALELAGEGELGAAMGKLREGEKLLEYAAESCRDIRKELILVVLHNMASASQAKWELSTTANYLQALIYNLQLACPPPPPPPPLLPPPSHPLLPHAPTAGRAQELTAEEEKEGVQLAEYYLQLCAVNSQLQRHGNALMALRKAHPFLHSSLLRLLFHPRDLYHAEQIDLPEWPHRLSVVKLLLENRCMGGEADRTALINYSYLLWRADAHSHRRHPSAHHFRALSIADVMTISLRAVSEPNKAARLQDSLLYLPLIASVGFFSLATELQLVEQSASLSEARNAHALAIMLYQLLVPFESPYLHHIRDNYAKIFGILKAPEIPPKRLPSHKELLELLRRDSISEASLHQDSIETQEQDKRKGERLKQSQRLKHICLNQLKPKQPKPNTKKSQAKSLTVSHHKQSLEARDTSNKPKTNTTHHPSHPTYPAQDYYKKTTRKRKERKETQAEDFEEKYYDLAFKRLPFKSPSKKRKDSIRSSSSTKDRSLGKPSPIKVGRNEKEVEKLVRVRSKQRLKS